MGKLGIGKLFAGILLICITHSLHVDCSPIVSVGEESEGEEADSFVLFTEAPVTLPPTPRAPIDPTPSSLPPPPPLQGGKEEVSPLTRIVTSKSEETEETDAKLSPSSGGNSESEDSQAEQRILNLPSSGAKSEKDSSSRDDDVGGTEIEEILDNDDDGNEDEDFHLGVNVNPAVMAVDPPILLSTELPLQIVTTPPIIAVDPPKVLSKEGSKGLEGQAQTALPVVLVAPNPPKLPKLTDDNNNDEIAIGAEFPVVRANPPSVAVETPKLLSPSADEPLPSRGVVFHTAPIAVSQPPHLRPAFIRPSLQKYIDEMLNPAPHPSRVANLPVVWRPFDASAVRPQPLRTFPPMVGADHVVMDPVQGQGVVNQGSNDIGEDVELMSGDQPGPAVGGMKGMNDKGVRGEGAQRAEGVKINSDVQSAVEAVIKAVEKKGLTKDKKTQRRGPMELHIFPNLNLPKWVPVPPLKEGVAPSAPTMTMTPTTTTEPTTTTTTTTTMGAVGVPGGSGIGGAGPGSPSWMRIPVMRRPGPLPQQQQDASAPMEIPVEDKGRWLWSWFGLGGETTTPPPDYRLPHQHINCPTPNLFYDNEH